MSKDAEERTSANVLIPGRDPDELRLTFAGSVVKHLGVQMYAGRPVPAIAELISNSWDADAKTTRVTLPLDAPWRPDYDSHRIVVEDDGNGMTWEMVRDAYLDVGRDRRLEERRDRSDGERPLQGRKGIGKLAGFGIADVVEVQTVHRENHPDLGERALIWFRLAYQDLQKAGRNPAKVDLVYAGPVSKAPRGARLSEGTTVALRRLRERRAINPDQFRRSMTRRFLFMGPGFRVTVNGEDLLPEQFDLQWRWPGEGWTQDEVEGCGPVEYWIGFTAKPLRQSEGDLSGILIYTRNKVSQEATFFDISGGVTGQHGLRYMCGMVRAEWLDGGLEEPDLIATHRGSIAWESPQGQAFQRWGRDLVRKYLAEWAKRRTALREKQVRELTPRLRSRVQGLAEPYRDIALRFVEKFKAVEMEPEEFEDIFSWFLDALENASLRRILEKLRETDASDIQQLDDLLSRMEIRTAVTLLQIIDSNLAAIDTLERMHLEDALERGVIAKHLERNPWLIHPTWMLSKSEARVATWVREKFGLKPKGHPGDKDRADFFCVAVAGTLHIVEIKRGRFTAKDKDILQADKYRGYVLGRFKEIKDPEGIRYDRVQSHLVASQLHDDAVRLAETYADKGWVFFTTWPDLIERARLSHRQFREVLEQTASKAELDEQRQLPSSETSTDDSAGRSADS